MEFPVYNYHTHTKRCGHAVGEDAEYVACGIRAGFQVLGISDHSPYRGVYTPKNRMYYEHMEGYLRSFAGLRERYRGQINLRIGFEAEYFEDYEEELRQLHRISDYLILGQHTLHKADPVSVNNSCSKQDALEYADLVCRGLKTGLFSYLAHPDYYMKGTDDISGEFLTAAHQICGQASESHVPLEINIKGVMEGKKKYRQGDYYCYPNRIFWEIASQYPIVCIYGFDAHKPEFLEDTEAFEKAGEVIWDLGLTILEKPFL